MKNDAKLGDPALMEVDAGSQKKDRPTEVFIFARFHAKEGGERALGEAIREEIQQARGDYGCLAIDAYASSGDTRLFFIHSRWVKKAAFEAHAATPHTLHFIELAETLIDHPLDVNRTQVLGGETYRSTSPL